MMKQQHIARLEAHLEGLVEGVFAALFGRTLRAHDIALQLARAMEDSLQPATGDDPRPIAPDQYMIYASPAAQKALLEKYQHFQHTLVQHLIELAALCGYRLLQQPHLKILADAKLDSHQLNITASHSLHTDKSTAVMEQILLPPIPPPPQAQFVLNGGVLPLEGDIINLGRSRENHIVLDDPFVSRHHVQLRLRAGAYWVFDIQSQGGTYINEVRVREHRLKVGDILRIGQTSLLYLQEDALSDSQANPTQPIEIEQIDT